MYFVIFFVQFVHASFFFFKIFYFFSWKIILLTLSLWHRNENAFPESDGLPEKRRCTTRLGSAV